MRNAKLLIGLLGFEFLVFWYGIEKIFMSTDVGMTDFQIVTSGFLLFTFRIISEVPSGALADRWSRKYTMALSVITVMASTAIAVTAPVAEVYYLSAILWGTAYSLLSGTYESLLFDSLKAENKEKEYSRRLGYVRSALAGGVLLGFTFSGVIADQTTMAFTFYISFIPLVIALILAFLLKEPTIKRTTDTHTYLEHLNDAYKIIRHNQHLLAMTLALGVLGMAVGMIWEFHQLYLIPIAVPIIYFGFGGALFGLMETVWSRYAHKFEHRNRQILRRNLLIIAFASIALATILQSVVGYVALALVIASYIIFENLTMTDIQNKLPEEIRATSASFIGLLQNLLSLPVTIGFAFLAEYVSIFLAFGLISLMMGTYVLSIILKRSVLIYEH